MNRQSSSSRLSAHPSVRAAALCSLLSAGCAFDATAVSPAVQEYQKGTVASQAEPGRPVEELYAKPLRDLMRDMIALGTPFSTQKIADGVWAIRYRFRSGAKRYTVLFMSTEDSHVLPDRDGVQIEEFDTDSGKENEIGDSGLTGSPSNAVIEDGSTRILFHHGARMGLEHRATVQQHESRLVATVRELFDRSLGDRERPD